MMDSDGIKLDNGIKGREQIFEFIFKSIQRLDISRPKLIGIDGIDGSGKSIFAADLTAFLKGKNLKVIHSSIDYFHNPRAERYSEDKPNYLSFFENSFNYDALKEILLDPVKHGSKNNCKTKFFDHKVDAPVKSRSLSFCSSSILVFDGIFNHRDEVYEYWDFSIFLDVTFVNAYKRMAARDGCPPNPEDSKNERYYKGQQVYFQRCNPQGKATLLIDNNDFESPYILRE